MRPIHQLAEQLPPNAIDILPSNVYLALAPIHFRVRYRSTAVRIKLNNDDDDEHDDGIIPRTVDNDTTTFIVQMCEMCKGNGLSLSRVHELP